MVSNLCYHLILFPRRCRYALLLLNVLVNTNDLLLEHLYVLLQGRLGFSHEVLNAQHMHSLFVISRLSIR